MGNTCLRLADTDAAQLHYQKSREIFGPLLDLAPDSGVVQANYMLALARCGQVEPAAELAFSLAENHPDNPHLLVSAACGEAICAAVIAGGAEPEQLEMKDRVRCLEHRSRALHNVSEALNLDYGLLFLLRVDPDTVPLQQLPEFIQLLNRVESIGLADGTMKRSAVEPTQPP